MGISLLDQLQLIRDVIENEHGGVVYDGEDYITPDWDKLIECVKEGRAVQYKRAKGRYSSFENFLENT
jgi:hypothetical protein